MCVCFLNVGACCCEGESLFVVEGFRLVSVVMESGLVAADLSACGHVCVFGLMFLYVNGLCVFWLMEVW